MHFSLCIPLNGGRTGIINLRHPGDESSVKERGRESEKEKERERETERDVGGKSNLQPKKRASCFCIDQADDSHLVNVVAKPSW